MMRHPGHRDALLRAAPHSDVHVRMGVQEQEEAGLTEWERWARLEYIRLATEEEHDDIGMETGDDVWGAGMDQG